MRKNAPLTESMFYILLSLKETLHGYGIIKKVEQMSKGRLILAPGTLYGALTNLEKNKLIEAVGVDPDNPRRKLYIITSQGETTIKLELNRLEEMVNNGRGIYND
jgi:DNA-binding PadR family transcriptional regulator